MEKEIHRMRLRFDTLKRDQERMIKEMERCIFKREAISIRARGKKDGQMTQASLRKQISSQRSDLRKIAGQGQAVDNEIDGIARQMESVSVELESASKEYGTVEDDANRVQRDINEKLYEKQQNLESVNKNRRLAERYEKTMDNPTISLGEMGTCGRARRRNDCPAAAFVRNVHPGHTPGR